ncbi:transposase family protein [Streptomyces sp. NPDC048251]|uniref:helix-turn-helix domain-containing protein n=1 Tax=Streptomyces sp. NPDC048251 TaxID=3154501 RepID=UPI00343EB565
MFTDRIIATLIVLRFQLPHAALAVLYGVDRSTITRAVHEIRPLLAARGFACHVLRAPPLSWQSATNRASRDYPEPPTTPNP